MKKIIAPGAALVSALLLRISVSAQLRYEETTALNETGSWTELFMEPFVVIGFIGVPLCIGILLWCKFWGIVEFWEDNADKRARRWRITRRFASNAWWALVLPLIGLWDIYTDHRKHRLQRRMNTRR